MENTIHKWRFIAGKIIYFYGTFSMAMLNNQMVLKWDYPLVNVYKTMENHNV
jgi:hypothetical protein